MSFSYGSATRTSLPLVLFVSAVVLVAGSGASCPNVIRGYQVGVMPLPRTLPAQPTREQIIAAIEDNTSRVRSYAATQAVLVVPGVPRLLLQVACEPPRRFRLRAQTSLTGNELDIGSNDDLFWLWIRRHDPPIMLFCEHESTTSLLLDKCYRFGRNGCRSYWAWFVSALSTDMKGRL